MSSKGPGTMTMVLFVIVLLLAVSLGSYYANTSATLSSQSKEMSGLQSAVSSLLAHPSASTITSVSTVSSTVTSVQTTTYETNMTVTQTATSTTTVASTTLPWYGLDYLTDLSGCTVSSGTAYSSPAPCWGQSNGVLFNCAGTASTSQGCTERVNLVGTNENFNVTVWYPYPVNGSAPWQNCKWTEPIPLPIGPQTGYAYCFLVNSTTFMVSVPASPPA